MAYIFCFGDTFSDELGIKVEGTPDIEIAQRAGEQVSIPGKDGDDYIDYGRYKNVEFSRDIAVVQKGSKTVPEMIKKIIDEYAYLYGYQYFEDSDHFNLSTEARLTNFGEFKRELRRLGRATLTFSRKPFWYDVTSLQYTDVSLVAAIPTKIFDNPFKLTAKPIIEITTAGTPTTIQYSITDADGVETTYSVVSAYTSTIVIDCEKETVRIDGSGWQDAAVPDGFKPGENTFKLLSGKSVVKSIKIMPRWRCLI